MTVDGERKSTLKTDRLNILPKDDGLSSPVCNTFFHTLVQNVSDKLRSPLFVIKSYSQLLQRTKEKDRLDRGFALIEEASSRMEFTISELVNLVEIYTKESPISELYYFRQAYDKAILNLYEPLKLVDAKITTNFKDETKVWFNGDFLEIILTQLLSNALLHNMDKSDLKIEISSYKIMERLVLEIRDNGLGFNKSNLKEKIKDPFNTQTHLLQCVGVGLSKVEAIAKVTGSVFEIETKPNHGTICRFYFR